MKKILLLNCVLACLIHTASCSRKLVENLVVPEVHECTMTIAGDSSEFKDSIRDRIIQKYRRNCQIHVVNIEDLHQVDAAHNDVVVIMDTCMAWSRFNPSLKAFLDNEKNRKKTVLSITAANPDWQYHYKEVDAITSASQLSDSDLFFSRIDAQIEWVLNNRI